MSLTARAPEIRQGFEFNIGQVADLLGINIRRETPGGADADCPFCGHLYKLNLNLGANVFRCNRCGVGGGMLELYRRCRELPDTKEAYAEITEALRCGTSSSSRWTVKVERSRQAAKEQANRASDEVCDSTYRAMLELLCLYDWHKEALEMRGLSADQIQSNLYRSTTWVNTRVLCNCLLSAGHTLRGVPGFWEDEQGQWHAKLNRYNEGILIPVVSAAGMISGFQIRLDQPYGGRKYTWFTSSGQREGLSSGSPYHFVGDLHDKVVYLTEGALKADVAHALLGKTIGAIPGVAQFNSLRALLGRLKENGVETVCEAYDMDKRTNVHVQEAQRRLFQMAREFDFKLYSVTWNSEYKGIDDWALARKQQKI